MIECEFLVSRYLIPRKVKFVLKVFETLLKALFFMTGLVLIRDASVVPKWRGVMAKSLRSALQVSGSRQTCSPCKSLGQLRFYSLNLGSQRVPKEEWGFLESKRNKRKKKRCDVKFYCICEMTSCLFLN